MNYTKKIFVYITAEISYIITYTEKIHHYKLQILEARRKNINVVLVWKNFYNFIDSNYSLASFKFSFNPYILRSRLAFAIFNFDCNYTFNSQLVVCAHSWNVFFQIQPQLGLFNISLEPLKHFLKLQNVFRLYHLFLFCRSS